MSYALSDFEAQLILAVGKFYRDPNEAAELNAIRIALGADATTHDATIQLAPPGLQPGNRANSPFVNAVLKLINRGKGGNLSTISMANIIGGVAPPGAPVNTVPPTISYQSGGGGAGTVGALYIRTVGTWTPTGGIPSQQWYSGGAPVPGMTATSYTAQDSDSGNSIACAVQMTLNGQTSAPAMSNLVAIA